MKTYEQLNAELTHVCREQERVDAELSYLKQHGSRQDYEAMRKEWLELCRKESVITDQLHAIGG